MVFDVKMDFAQKARFVAGGHTTKTPSSMTYSSVVSRDSVRILLTIAALNDLDVYACDVNNAYLNAPCLEKIWFRGGAECREDKGKVLVVVRALYGLKSSGASWRQIMCEALDNMGFFPSQANNDVWLQETIRDSEQLYEYVLLYVDDILSISHRGHEIVQEIGTWFALKDLEQPTASLGAEIGKQDLKDGSQAWYMSADHYLEGAFDVVQRLYDEDGAGRAPLPLGY